MTQVLWGSGFGVHPSVSTEQRLEFARKSEPEVEFIVTILGGFRDGEKAIALV
jgi:hypothetical protein